ncbi:MAG: CBS domain-containing protein [SAR202 cluster bacterium]|nr:CBS domain-containing protein [SAR202 cluster bacterium]
MISDETGPVFGIFTYLAYINALLGAFNLLPGFPLDGGRVLRAILWRTTGDPQRATRTAALVGQAFGWALIGLGLYQVLAGNYLGGLWMAFLGWFLNSAADTQRRESILAETFKHVPVGQLMNTSPEVVPPEMPMDELVRARFLGKGRRVAAVCEGQRPAGIVSLSNVRGIPEGQWPAKQLADVMTRNPLHGISPEADVTEALRMLGEHDVNQVAVLKNGALVGMLSRADVVRYLQLREELGPPMQAPKQSER